MRRFCHITPRSRILYSKNLSFEIRCYTVFTRPRSHCKKSPIAATVPTVDFLPLPEEGHSLLENFRKVTGEKASSPSIEDFYEFIQQKNQRIKGKKALP